VAEDVHDEIPCVRGVLVAEVPVARPPEEGDGSARVRVGEAEHLLDISGGDAYIGVVDRRDVSTSAVPEDRISQRRRILGGRSGASLYVGNEVADGSRARLAAGEAAAASDGRFGR
jgi:hypothetical protein